MDIDTTLTDKNRLISLAEASKLYGFSSNYLGNLIRRGRLNAQKIGNSWGITIDDMETFISSRKKRGVFREDIQIN